MYSETDDSKLSFQDNLKCRRSNRVSQKKAKCQQLNEFQDLIRSGVDVGVSEICAGDFLQRGVIATQSFKKGDFVVEYAGDYVTTREELKHRLADHDKNGRFGSFIYWFRHQGRWQWCVLILF